MIVVVSVHRTVNKGFLVLVDSNAYENKNEILYQTSNTKFGYFIQYTDVHTWIY